ncbi:MAG: uroD1, partial [Bacillota bacterium]|nr:uroD1 [Bacillota bacterium]
MKKFEDLINKKIEPILIDMYVESEILGCEVIKQSNKVMINGPLCEEAYIPCKCRIPNENSGRMPEILEEIVNKKNSLKENKAICIALSGPLT